MNYTVDLTVTWLKPGSNGLGERGGYTKQAIDPEEAQRLHAEHLDELIAGIICNLEVHYVYHVPEVK